MSTADMIRAHSDVLLLVHVVFATVDRRRLLPPSMDAWLHAELREQARRCEVHLLGVGNADDHVHAVLSIQATTALAPLMKQLKGVSCREWNLQNPSRPLRWQSGYWARSIQSDSLGRLLPYLRDQRARHGSGLIEPDFEQNEATLVDDEHLADT
jgi:REP-associated tyrosine transposase